MTFTIARRTAAVTALAVAAFSGVALVGSAVTANAAAKSHTSLSIRSVHAGINPGGSDEIIGSLHARDGRVGGHLIALFSKANGTTTWAKVKQHRTGVHGNIAFEVTPAVTTRYRLAFPGNKFQQASQSGIVTVRVRNTTSLTIALSATSIQPGSSDTVSGDLSLGGSALVGDTVDLASRNAHHGFAKIGSQVTASDGSVSFTVTPGITTQYVLVFVKNSTNAGARSAIATVHVLRTSSLSIRARANRKAGDEVISGNLRGGGSPLAHRKVTLMDRPDGTGPWTAVATHLTVHNGDVAFTEAAPTSTEDYQLVFSGGQAFDGCQSGIVTVTVS
jgi:hypothetical protein